MDIVTSEQLVELARMGFYINSKDTASSPLKALAMASRSVKQPVYTASLRKKEILFFFKKYRQSDLPETALFQSPLNLEVFRNHGGLGQHLPCPRLHGHP